MDCPKCEVGEIKDEDDVIRERRKFIACLLNGLNLRFLTIDNGIKYQAMYYVEIAGEHIKDALDNVLRCINDSLNSMPGELRDHMRFGTKSFDDAYVIMFNNEYITIKAIW